MSLSCLESSFAVLLLWKNWHLKDWKIWVFQSIHVIGSFQLFLSSCFLERGVSWVSKIKVMCSQTFVFHSITKLWKGRVYQSLPFPIWAEFWERIDMWHKQKTNREKVICKGQEISPSCYWPSKLRPHRSS